MKKNISLLILLSLVTLPTVAQQFDNIQSINQLFELYQQDAAAGKRDAQKILQGYLTPLMNGVGYGSANGWFNTAKPHEVGGFDFTFNISAAMVPDEDLTFSPGTLEMVDIQSPVDGKIPSIIGPSFAPVFQHKQSGNTFDGLAGIDMKGNIGSSFIPTPMAQIGIGLPMNSEIKLRYVPNFNSASSGISFNLLGIGVLHSLNQYLPKKTELPLNIAAFGGFNQMNLEIDLSQAKDGSQLGIFKVRSYTLQGVVSKDMSIITGYAAFGVTNSQLKLAIKGDFNVDNDPSTFEITDPIDFTFGGISPKVTVGLKLKLVALTLHADYSYQKYNSLNAGIGISIK